MTSSKERYIKLFRDHGFNCFPIPSYPDDHANPKSADSRYKAVRTIPNQVISPEENYGVIPLQDGGTVFLDLDHKELYRKFAEENITNGYMVIETPNGWHIPVVGLSGVIKKMMFYDKDVEPTKQIVEIQGHDHYVIGAGSSIWNAKKGQRGFYENKGSEVMWNAKGMDFNEFSDNICRALNVTAKESTKGANYNMRQRFKDGKPPTKGTSNYYWYNASIQCLTDGLIYTEAETKLRQVYDKWVSSDTFSGRTWENVVVKLKDAYEHGEPLTEGRPSKVKDDNLVVLCQKIIVDRKIYSDQITDEIFENTDGFIENITDKLHKQLQQSYPEMTKEVFNEIKFRLVGLAPDVPETNKSLKVFDNGVYDERARQLVNTEEVASMGFKGYNYLEPSVENEPTEFIKLMFSNIPEHEHKRLKAGLKSAISPILEPRISVVYGDTGVGKSIGMEILFKVLNKYQEYAFSVELDQLLSDPFIKAKVKGKTLMILTDLPDKFKDFSKLKALTGEAVKTERAFHQDATTFDNMLKIFASANYLAKIPSKEKNAMWRRLSLSHNTRKLSYKTDGQLADRVVKDEGEKIMSWILNIPDSDCEYESVKTVAIEWDAKSSPELEYMDKYWQFGDTMNEISVMKLRKDFEEKYNTSMPHPQFLEALKEQGYYINKNMVANIIPVIQKEVKAQSML